MKQLKKQKQIERVSRCSRCRREPQLPGQRYGKRCHAKAQAEYRERRRAAAKKLHRTLNQLGRMVAEFVPGAAE